MNCNNNKRIIFQNQKLYCAVPERLTKGDYKK